MVVAQQDHTVDKRIIKVEPLNFATLEDAELEWFATEDNKDYLIDEFVLIHQSEADSFREASAKLYQLAIDAAFHVASQKEWKAMGVPAEAIELVRYSLKEELGLHLIGRFDFAGGLDDVNIKLIEFNADTCSLMPETEIIQENHWEQEKAFLPGSPYNPLQESLMTRFKHILNRYPDKERTLLISTMGHEEDWLNAEIIDDAARAAGFEVVQCAPLDQVIFSADEGIYLEMETDEYHRFDFWYKFIPWDFIINEERELFGILDSIIRNELGVVLNPAYTMLLQSKALLKFMYDLSPENPYLLKASLEEEDFPDRKFVGKPIYGRMGENITFYDGGDQPTYETEGDYGESTYMYQALAPFNIDLEGHRYQPSVFWTGEPAGICIRRQDDLVIDDDAEFVGHIVQDN